ncbi:ankyrin repeat-containing protein [Fusarium sp. NRRL 52700]|nr:ankyrin repeat-containing protein [Fusarium sp. NRRL 52700]
MAAWSTADRARGPKHAAQDPPTPAQTGIRDDQVTQETWPGERAHKNTRIYRNVHAYSNRATSSDKVTSRREDQLDKDYTDVRYIPSPILFPYECELADDWTSVTSSCRSSGLERYGSGTEDRDKIIAPSTRSNSAFLLRAAGEGHDEVVRLLLDSNIEVDVKDACQRTPLSIASEKGHKTIVELLLGTYELDVDARDCWKRTPLLWAAETGNVEIVKILLETQKAKVNARDFYGYTPLWLAAGNNHKTGVEILGSDEIDVDQKDDICGQTPLSWDAGNGCQDVVDLFLNEKKIDVDSRDLMSRSPLLLATLGGHKAIAAQHWQGRRQLE